MPECQKQPEEFELWACFVFCVPDYRLHDPRCWDKCRVRNPAVDLTPSLGGPAEHESANFPGVAVLR